jgi:hypothetical protein
MKIRTRCLSAVVAGSALALLATPAHAAVERIDEPYACVEFPEDGLLLCQAFSMQTNSVATPAGVRVYSGRYTLDFTITIPAQNYSYSGSTVSHFGSVYGKGADVSRNFTYDVSVENGLTCVFERKFIFAGGQVRVGEETTECS